MLQKNTQVLTVEYSDVDLSHHIYKIQFKTVVGMSDRIKWNRSTYFLAAVSKLSYFLLTQPIMFKFHLICEQGRNVLNQILLQKICQTAVDADKSLNLSAVNQSYHPWAQGSTLISNTGYNTHNIVVSV